MSLKRRREQALTGEMIALYCKKRHRLSELCPDCAQLRAYVARRIDRCPYMETKTFCSKCPAHCYNPEMRGKIRAVMRFSGPRILLKHPVMAARHAYHSRRKTS